MNRVKIVFAKRWNYFQWFLLGFYLLQKQGKIKVDIQVPVLQRLSLWNHNSFLSRCGGALLRRIEGDSDLLLGEAELEGKSVKFAIDSADAPFLFDRKVLDQVDVYFKMQCPKEFSPSGFPLTRNVTIPWTDYAFLSDESVDYVGKKPKGKRKVFKDIERYKDRIYPLMIGPRRLARGNDFSQLLKGYENILQSRKREKVKNVMCYFGNAEGPGRSEHVTENTIDYDWERDIMGLYPELNHPNEKRAVIRDIVKTLPDSDARIISEGNSDAGGISHPELVVPLEQFGAHVAQFRYNVNVSGYRMSIPNRFIDSFSVDTSIVTDDLKVKWYKPFAQEEVMELGPMGYEPMESVNWSDVRERLKSLPEQKPGAVEKLFDEKWRPDVVAEYMLDTMLGAKRER